jgi:hypothetical protein
MRFSAGQCAHGEGLIKRHEQGCIVEQSGVSAKLQPNGRPDLPFGQYQRTGFAIKL